MSDPLVQLNEVLTGRYRIERKLGAGGMATVYLAHDIHHDRPVALKLLDADLAAELGTGRFTREIRLAARLQHSHICSVFDSGENGDLCWFTMPYIQGESLEERIKREETLPVDDALRIAREAAKGLAYAHSQGVIHRDIKPGNLLLAADGSTLVADFGIARSMFRDPGRDVTLTQTGYSPGTPAYMSPEQQAADKDIDGRSDVYSLGVVLFEMLAGERPYAGGALAAAMAQLMTDPLPRLAQRRPEIPPQVDQLLQRVLVFDRNRRIGTMAEFGEELESLRMGRSAPVNLGVMSRLSGALKGWFAPKPVSSIKAETTQTPPSSAAVLPFRDLSPAQDQTYFSDGLAEELTTALSRIPGLKVAARSAAFRFRGPTADPREAGKALGVGAVVSGSVRKSGDRLRVSAQLVNVADGFELWSESYDRDVADVFRVQEEIAQSIVGALRIRLLSGIANGIVPGPTADLQAYDLFLQGRFAWHQRTSQTLPEAARCFQAAVERDPNFARAWAGVADSNTLLPPYCGTSPAIAWPRAKAAAERAIALDPRLPDAHTSLAYGTMLYEWDWAKAEQCFRKAIEADPNYQIAHHWYADFLAGRERFEESLASMLRAREIDPLSRITGVELAWVYYLLNRLDEAEYTVRQILRLDPTYAHAHFVFGLVQLAQQKAPEAVQSLERGVELGGFYAHLAGGLIAAQVRAGRREAALATLADLTQRAANEYVPPSAFAIGYGALGEMDKAFAALNRGIAERDVVLPENFFEPLFDPLKADPRYPPIAALIRGR